MLRHRNMSLTHALVHYTCTCIVSWSSFSIIYSILLNCSDNEPKAFFCKIKVISHYFCQCFNNGHKHLHTNSYFHTWLLQKSLRMKVIHNLRSSCIFIKIWFLSLNLFYICNIDTLFVEMISLIHLFFVYLLLIISLR